MGNALFFLRMLSMCKHWHIAQLVICMWLHTDRIHKSKVHFYCVCPCLTNWCGCFQWCNLTSSEENEAVSVWYSSQIKIYLKYIRVFFQCKWWHWKMAGHECRNITHWGPILNPPPKASFKIKGFKCNHVRYQVGHVMRTPIYAICEQQMFRPDCASTQSDQQFCSSLLW